MQAKWKATLEHLTPQLVALRSNYLYITTEILSKPIRYLNKQMQDTVMNYFLENHVGVILKKPMRLSNMKEVHATITKETECDLTNKPKYMILMNAYVDKVKLYGLEEQYQSILWKIFLEEEQGSLFSDEGITQIRLRTVAIMLLTHFCVDNRDEIVTLYNLWNIVYPKDPIPQREMSSFGRLKKARQAQALKDEHIQNNVSLASSAASSSSKEDSVFNKQSDDQQQQNDEEETQAQEKKQPETVVIANKIEKPATVVLVNKKKRKAEARYDVAISKNIKLEDSKEKTQMLEAEYNFTHNAKDDLQAAQQGQQQQQRTETCFNEPPHQIIEIVQDNAILAAQTVDNNNVQNLQQTLSGMQNFGLKIDAQFQNPYVYQCFPPQQQSQPQQPQQQQQFGFSTYPQYFFQNQQTMQPQIQQIQPIQQLQQQLQMQPIQQQMQQLQQLQLQQQMQQMQPIQQIQQIQQMQPIQQIQPIQQLQQIQPIQQLQQIQPQIQQIQQIQPQIQQIQQIQPQIQQLQQQMQMQQMQFMQPQYYPNNNFQMMPVEQRTSSTCQFCPGCQKTYEPPKRDFAEVQQPR